MGASILIVEDEEPLTTLLRYNLEEEKTQLRPLMCSELGNAAYH